MKNLLKLLLPALCLLPTLGAQTSVPPDESSAARLERFLAAMGGRDAWREVRSVTVRATHYETELRQPYANAIWNDFTRPRVRFEAKSAELDRVRAIDGDTGWRTREGALAPLMPEQVRDDLRWWEANIYRTLHRLAANDPALTVRAIGANRLEVWRTGGVRLNWFELNFAGEPVRFGTWDNENGTVFGPLATSGALRYPRWGTNAAGTWRYEISSFTPLEKLPADVSFSVP
jgi:hypothetical protein